MLLFIMLCKVVLAFESVDDETLKCDHSNEEPKAVMGCF